jgi:hypothetical protein
MVMDFASWIRGYVSSGCHLHAKGVNEIHTNQELHKGAFIPDQAAKHTSHDVNILILMMDPPIALPGSEELLPCSFYSYTAWYSTKAPR